jgi:hypothetical protein
VHASAPVPLRPCLAVLREPAAPRACAADAALPVVHEQVGPGAVRELDWPKAAASALLRVHALNTSASVLDETLEVQFR